MNKEQLVFNKNNLLKYLIEYDYIQEKYGVDKNSEGYNACAEYESQNLSADVVKRDYSSIYENIRLVYGDTEKANEMMMVYKIVKEEVVNKFLNIPGLERIYDEHFFEFEWDMHSRLDFDNHNISFYRDHFIHQVRNLYEMNEFFSNEAFYKEFKQEFCYGNSKIATYVDNGIKRIMSKNCNGSMMPNLFKRSERYKYRGLYIDYIIKASTALCTLFHDIGYPIIHFNKLRARISGFMPSMYMFFGSESNNFENIYALLSNSLLFRIVSKKELNKAVCNNENHGAVSAVAFLLTFYETGVIGRLSEDKRIAIEIAAVAIYNHTIQYELMDNSTEQGYYSPIYKLNPISYLLRLCDDIQEWERTYFEIQDIPDILICEKCGTLMTRSIRKEGGFKTQPFVYQCKCINKKGTTNNYIRRNNDYVRIKIIDIINCREVRVKFDNPVSDKPMIWIELDYDPALLLKMCLFVPAYSKYRIKDLNKFKYLLTGQRFSPYTAMGVKYLLTPNPLILKANIIGNMMGLYDIAGKRFTNGLIYSEDADVNNYKDHAHNTSYITAAEFLTEHNDVLREKIHDKEILGNLINDTKILKGFLEPVRTVIDKCAREMDNTASEIDNLLNKTNIQKHELDKTIRKIKEGMTQAHEDTYTKVCKLLTDTMRKEAEDIRKKLKELIQNLLEKCADECENDDLKDKISNFYENCNNNNLTDIRVTGFKLYLLLHILSVFFAKMNSLHYAVWKNKCIIGESNKGGWTSACNVVANTIKDLLSDRISNNKHKLQLKIFICDAIDQYAKMFSNNDNTSDRLCTEEYYKQFVTEDKVYLATRKYSDKYNPVNNQEDEPYDYYSDLDLYIKLSEYTRQIYKIIDHYDTTNIIIK